MEFLIKARSPLKWLVALQASPRALLKILPRASDGVFVFIFLVEWLLRLFIDRAAFVTDFADWFATRDGKRASTSNLGP